MENKDLEIKRKIGFLKGLKIMIILLAILNLAFPLIFAWIVEISMEFTPNVYLTNGFRVSEPIQTYHFALWGLVFSSIMTSLFVFYSLDKFIWGKNGETN